MANPLTLVIPLKEGIDLGQLQAGLAQLMPNIGAAMEAVGTVHYSRVALLDRSSPNLQPGPTSGPFSLAVITEYDGDFNAYIQDFVAKVGPIFDTLLSFTVGGTEITPVADHIAAFIATSEANDVSQQPPACGRSTRPTRRRCSRSSPHSVAAAMMTRRRQGTVLRGYRVDLARHFVLSVADAAGARAFIARSSTAPGCPEITTAARWTSKPECFVNVGFTVRRPGRARGDAGGARDIRSAFQRGATDPASAAAVGDVGESAPGELDRRVRGRRARAHRAEPVGGRGRRRAREGDGAAARRSPAR